MTAVALGLNPRTFAVAVTYAASCSFLTPLEPACVLIYMPGGYRFLDFVKIGSILTILSLYHRHAARAAVLGVISSTLSIYRRRTT